MAAFLAIFFESADRSAVLHQLGQVKIEDKLDGTLGLDEVQAPVLAIGIGIQAGGRCDHVGTCWGTGTSSLAPRPALSLSLSLFLSLPRGCPLSLSLSLSLSLFFSPCQGAALSPGGDFVSRSGAKRSPKGVREDGGGDSAVERGERTCLRARGCAPVRARATWGQSRRSSVSRARSPHPITPLRQALAEYNLQKEEDDGNVLSVEYNPDRCPGDLGFDPLKLQRNDANKTYLHNVEVNVGRLAMIGVTSFLVREFAIKDL
jgi:hypothetical protein